MKTSNNTTKTTMRIALIGGTTLVAVLFAVAPQSAHAWSNYPSTYNYGGYGYNRSVYPATVNPYVNRGIYPSTVNPYVPYYNNNYNRNYGYNYGNRYGYNRYNNNINRNNVYNRNWNGNWNNNWGGNWNNNWNGNW